MADEGRWIATPKDKPIEVKIDNIDDIVNHKPVPVVSNIPLDDYLEQQKHIEELSKQNERLRLSKKKYFLVLHKIFGGCNFLKSLNPEVLESRYTNNEKTDTTTISIEIPNKYYKGV